MPATGRLTPPGTAPSGSAGAGRRIALRLASTSFAAVPSSRDTPPVSTAAPATTPAVARNSRRLAPRPAVQGRAQQPVEHEEAHDQAEQGRDGIQRPRTGAGEHGTDRDQAEEGDDDRAGRAAPPAQDTGEDGEDDESGADAGQQHVLVLATEVLDGEVLQPGRGVVDERRAHGQDRRCGPPLEAHPVPQHGQHLGDPDGDRAGEEPGKTGQGNGQTRAFRCGRRLFAVSSRIFGWGLTVDRHTPSSQRGPRRMGPAGRRLQ